MHQKGPWERGIGVMTGNLSLGADLGRYRIYTTSRQPLQWVFGGFTKEGSRRKDDGWVKERLNLV